MHYDDKDIYGQEFCCDKCNMLVTVTNRLIKNVIDSDMDEKKLDTLERHIANVCVRLRDEKIR